MLANTVPSFIRGAWWIDIIESTSAIIFSVDYIGKVLFRTPSIERVGRKKVQISAGAHRYVFASN